MTKEEENALFSTLSANIPLFVLNGHDEPGILG